MTPIDSRARGTTCVGLCVCLLALSASTLVAQVEVAEATIPELQRAMETGQATSAQITTAYLARIEAYDQAGPRLNAMIRINPNAIAEAQALDRERAERGPRGPLHGIPVILKDNYDTFDMPTTAATLALAGSVPADDAFQVARLREAGAVILGKSNMHELASGITTIASLGGQTLNPYDLTRNPGGSSGGTGAAIAASFAAIGWGSDTCGSIRIPSSHNNLVGLRPTKGLSSIDGIIPLSHTQDVGGPLARTVGDLAIGLDATIGADAADPATRVLEGRTLPSFADALDPGALDGARIGILESHFGDGGEEAEVTRVVRAAIDEMVGLGADTLTVEIADYDDLIGGSGLIGFEAKWDLIEYLATVPNPPVHSLAEMVELGLIHEALIGNMTARASQESRDEEAYTNAMAKREPLRDAVVATMNAHSLDALVYPTIRTAPNTVGEPQRGSNCALSANTGLPALSVPAGFTRGLPVGIELMGRPLEDARLVSLAYALEVASSHREAPPATPPLVGGLAPAPLVADVRASSDGAEARVRFVFDAPTGALEYDVEVRGVPASDVYAVVLRHEDDEGRRYVASRLTGPGVVSATGTARLDARLRSRLTAGELDLELVTRGEAVRFARARVILEQP